MPLHTHIFSFTHNAVVLSNFICVHPENKPIFFFDFYILWIKTNAAYTRLAVIARTKYCTTTTASNWSVALNYKSNCFPQWARLQNMAVGDLDLYYTLYLCFQLRWNTYIKGGFLETQHLFFAHFTIFCLRFFDRYFSNCVTFGYAFFDAKNK